MAIQVMGKFSIDTSGADASLDSVAQKEKQLENQKSKLAVDTSGAIVKIDELKEKAKSALSGIGGGFLAGGAAIGIEKSLEAAKNLMKGQEDLKIALRQTGAEGANLDKKFQQSEAISASLADKYAKSKGELRGLATEIAGLGALSGPQASKVAEIGLAFEQVGIPAKALKAVIRGASDPESAAALDALKSKFPALTGALNSSSDAGGKMDAIYKALGPTLTGMKEAADGPLGQMEKMEQTGKKVETAFGSLIFGVLTPFIPIISAASTVITGGIIPALSSVTKFVNDNKTAVAILAGGIGIMALAMNAGAIGTTALGIAQKAQAAITGVVTGAQWLLNAALTANPIGIIVAGVGLLIGGLMLAYKYSDSFRKKIDELWGAVKSFIPGLGSLISMLGLSSDETKKSTDALGENKKLTDAAADAQKGLADAITGANAAFQKQFTDAQGTIDLNKATYLRQLAIIKNGYAEQDGVRTYYSAKEIQAFKESNAKLLAQAKDRGKLIADEKKKEAAFDSAVTPKTAKTNQDLLALAKQKADEAAKTLEIETRLQRAKEGQTFTDRDQLAVEQKRTAVFNEQVETLKVMTAEKGKFAGKTTLEVQQGQIKSLDLTAKIKLDDEKLQSDLNKSIQSLTKKKIELGILPKAEGIKLIESQIDELQQKLVVLKTKLVLSPGDPKVLTEINATNEAILGLTKERNDTERSMNDALTNARISNIQDETDKQLAARNQQLAADLQFVRDAADAGRELSKQELALKLQLEKKYATDVGAIRKAAREKELAEERALREGAVNSVVEGLKLEFAARQKFDRLAYEDKKVQLDKQAGEDRKAYQKGETSARDYALKLEKIAQDRAANELSATQAKWANEEKIVRQGYDFLEGQLTKYAIAQGQAALAGAAGDKTAADAHDKEAKGTMVGVVAKLIAQYVTSEPLIGAAIGVGASLALMAGFNAIEKSMGFAKGGTWVGENGPEIVAPKTDFSQMVSLLVSSTAQAVRHSMEADYGPVRSGGRNRMDVRVSGQFRNSGRAMVATVQQESIASRNERLIHN